MKTLMRLTGVEDGVFFQNKQQDTLKFAQS